MKRIGYALWFIGVCVAVAVNQIVVLPFMILGAIVFVAIGGKMEKDDKNPFVAMWRTITHCYVIAWNETNKPVLMVLLERAKG